MSNSYLFHKRNHNIISRISCLSNGLPIMTIAVRWWYSGHYNITISRCPGFDPRARQEKKFLWIRLFVHAVHMLRRFLLGDNLAMASHPRMGQCQKSRFALRYFPGKWYLLRAPWFWTLLCLICSALTQFRQCSLLISLWEYTETQERVLFCVEVCVSVSAWQSPHCYR